MQNCPEFRKFFLTKDFLYLYCRHFGLNETKIDIDRLTDHNDISTKSKNKFMFAISKLKPNFDIRTQSHNYNETSIKNLKVLFPNSENEKKQDKNILFLALIFNGFLNCSCDHLFESKREQCLYQTLLKQIKEYNYPPIQIDNQKLKEYEDDEKYNILYNEIFTNEDFANLHNELIEEVFSNKYDEYLNKKELIKENMLSEEKTKNKKNVNTKVNNDSPIINNDNSFNYSLFFVKEGKLFEFFPHLSLILEVKTDNQIITENNIFVNLESHVRVNGTDQYEEDFFIFSEVNKENQEEKYDLNVVSFIAVVLSCILLIINFFFFQPQEDSHKLYKLYSHTLIPLELTTPKKAIENIKSTLIRIPDTDTHTNPDYYYGYIDNSNGTNNPEENHNKDNLSNYIYIYDSNILSGFMLEYQELSSTPLYDFKYGEPKPKSSTLKSKEIKFFKADSTNIFDDASSIIPDNFYYVNIHLMIFNNNYQTTSLFTIKFKSHSNNQITNSISFVAFNPFIHFKSHSHSVNIIVLNVIYMLVLLYFLISIIRTLVEKFKLLFTQRTFYFSFDDILDIIVLILSVANEVIFCVLILFRSGSTFPVLIPDETNFNFWMDKLNAIDTYQILTGITMLLTCIRLAYVLCKCFPSFGLLIYPFNKACYEFIAVLIVFIVLILFFTCIAFCLFKPEIPTTFNSFAESFNNILMFINGIFDNKLLIKDNIGSNGALIAIFTILFMLVLFYLIAKISIGMYYMKYEKEINKTLLSNQAVNAIYVDKIKDVIEKLYCLFTCTPYDKYVNYKINKKKIAQQKKKTETKDKSSLPSTTSNNNNNKEQNINNNGIMFNIKEDNMLAVFSSNFRNLQLNQIFGKSRQTPEEFAALKRQKYAMIRKYNILNDLNEIEEDLEKKYVLLKNCILYIIYIVFFLLLLRFTIHPWQQQEIKDYISKQFNFNNNDVMSMTVTKAMIEDTFKLIYKNSNNQRLSPINNYAFINPFYVRTTLQMLKMNNKNQKEKDIKKYFPYFASDDDNKLNDDTTFKDKLYYTPPNNKEAVDKLGGFVFWLIENNPMESKPKESNLYNPENYTNSDIIPLNNDILFYDNKGYFLGNNLASFTLDFFMISKYSHFLVYVQIPFNRHKAGYFSCSPLIDPIPINRYVTSNDFTRFIFEVIYLLILILFTLDKFFIYLNIMSTLIKEDFDSLSETKQMIFANSSPINKFYRFDLSKYQNVKSCVICYTFWDILWIFIKRTLYFIYLLIKAFIIYLKQDYFNICEFASIVISFSMFGKLVKITSITKSINFQLHSDPLQTDISHRFDITKINELSMLYNTFKSWQGVNSILIFFKIVQFFKFSRSGSLIINTLSRATGMIITTFILWLIINFGFVLFGYAILSQIDSDFVSISSNFITILSFISGKRSLVQDNSFVVLLYILLFFIVNVFGFMNMLFGVLMFSFMDVLKREKMYFGNRARESLGTLLWVIMKESIIQKKINAVKTINKIINDGEYEKAIKIKFDNINQEQQQLKCCEYTTILNNFYTKTLNHIEDKSNDYFIYDNSIEYMMMVHAGLIIRQQEPNNVKNKQNYVTKLLASNQGKHLNLKIFNLFGDVNNSDPTSKGLLSVTEREKTLTKKNITENNENKEDTYKNEIIKLTQTNNKIFDEFISFFNNDVDCYYFKKNIFMKYYVFLYGNLKLYKQFPNIFVSQDQSTNNYNNKRFKSKRVYKLSKETQSSLSFKYDKIFYTENPLDDYESYLYQFNLQNNETSTNDLLQIQNNVFKLYLKYFLTPRTYYNNENISEKEKNLFLASHLCRYIFHNPERQRKHFIKNFMKTIISDFINELFPEKQNLQSQIDLISLLSISIKIRTLHSLIYNLLPRKQLKQLSNEYNSIYRNNKDSQSSNSQRSNYNYCNVYTYIVNDLIQDILNHPQTFDINPQNYSNEEMLLEIVNQESFSDLKYSNIVSKKEFLFYTNPFIAKCIFENDETLLKQKSTDEINKEQSQYLKDNNNYISRVLTSSLFNDTWSKLSQLQQKYLFYGYSNLPIKNNLVSFLSSKDINLHSIDVYSLLTPIQKADVVRLFSFSKTEMNCLRNITQQIISQYNLNIQSNEFISISNPYELIMLFHNKKMNYALQTEILLKYFTLMFNSVKIVITQIEKEYSKYYKTIINNIHSNNKSKKSFMQNDLMSVNTYTPSEKLAFIKYIETQKSFTKFEELTPLIQSLTFEKNEHVRDAKVKQELINTPLNESPTFDQFNNNENDNLTNVSNNKKGNKNSIYHAVLWLCSMSKVDFIETAMSCSFNKAIKQYFLTLYEFVYGCDETVCYYLKRNIKLNFIQKYEEYLKYYTLYSDELKKEKEFEREENQMKDAYDYLKSRNESYSILLNNLFKEKENLRREINEESNNNNNK